MPERSSRRSAVLMLRSRQQFDDFPLVVGCLVNLTAALSIKHFLPNIIFNEAMDAVCPQGA